jgi:hypothetical protein
MKRYRIRVYIPTEYELMAENKEQAAQIALEHFKREDKVEMKAYFTNSWNRAQVDVDEMDRP